MVLADRYQRLSLPVLEQFQPSPAKVGAARAEIFQLDEGNFHLEPHELGEFRFQHPASEGFHHALERFEETIGQGGGKKGDLDDLSSPRCFQHFFPRLGIGFHQASRAQEGAAEIARNHHRYIAQAGSVQHRQQRASRGARGFAVVGAELGAGISAAHDEGGNVVRRIGKFISDGRYEVARFLHGFDIIEAGDKTGIEDAYLGPGGPEGHMICFSCHAT
ncbi:hypothetical protein SDC9_05304 [bioreactor metagenome]|uniref:Uncharacterized protein n=1 Tax=bioreactor metagenome TaxID=1076179 RepID=A0A644SYM7_9ZZZZ